jgi:hypothetical protein
MRQYIDTAQDNLGNALVGAIIAVFDYPSNSVSSIYSDNGVTPIAGATVTTDATGQFSFFAADGDYKLTFTYASSLYKTQVPVAIFDAVAGVTFQDTGSTNAYAVTDSRLEGALRAGLRINIKIANTNNAASTFVYNGLASKAIVNLDGTALQAGALPQNGVVLLEYNGSSWLNRTYYQTTNVGAISGTTGTFSGAVSAASLTISGSATFGGNISAVNGTFSGTGSFTGALSAGSLTIGGTAFAISSGSFTPTWNGFSATPSGAINYQKVGNLVSLSFDSITYANGNSSTNQLTWSAGSIPAALRPSAGTGQRTSPMVVRDPSNSAGIPGNMSIFADGSMQCVLLSLNGSSTLWATSGSYYKGILGSFTYGL